MNWKQNLTESLQTEFIFDAPMSLYTTYKAGGAAEVLALPKTEEEIKKLIAFAAEHKINLRILGLGSNILVSDLGLEGIICCLRKLEGITLGDGTISAKAGTALDKVVEASVNAGFEGMEGLSGIPGSVGGAVYMNAGAFNAETFDCLEHFTILTEEGEIKTIKKDEVAHAYRSVALPKNCMVLSASWQPKQTQNAAGVAAKRAEVLAKRAEKQPLEYPSAGSVFKRPEGDYASRLIDVCGLRGFSVGGAMVSQKHAGFIINYKNATANDINGLIKEVQKRVLAQTGKMLELEQILWGKF